VTTAELWPNFHRFLAQQRDSRPPLRPENGIDFHDGTNGE